jgi:hypothetical protein
MACWERAQLAWTDDGHVSVKFSAESGKWAGRADELEARLLEIEHDQWLRDEKQRMSGGGN